MPDLLTHFTAAYFIARPEPMHRFRAVFYLGAVLPDLVSRPLYILIPELAQYTVACHTPVFIFFSCLLLAELFSQEIRRKVFIFLLTGAAVHFLLDALQKHLFGGYYWFFPFSWQSGEIGLFWPEEPLRFIPLWVAMIVLSEIYIAFKKRRSASY
ncbi:MAG TPA: hypothetical protein PLP19_17390 [bacterium]|nr:hypothetical protein [bacterium]HPN45269.1 hypothetical protein [bacterium]